MDNLLLILALYVATLSSTLLLTLPLSQGDKDGDIFEKCKRPYSCGNLTNIVYPFYGNGKPPYCGHPGFELKCLKNMPFIDIGQQEFLVLNIISSPPLYTMTLARSDLLESNCSSKYDDTRIDPVLFRYTHDTTENITVHYGCQLMSGLNEDTPSYNYNYTCGVQDGITQYAFYEDKMHSPGAAWIRCHSSTAVPVVLNPLEEPAGGEAALTKALDRGFDVEYMVNWSQCILCHESSGYCGRDAHSGGGFSCICETGQYNPTCPVPRPPNVKAKVAIGVGTAGGVALLMSIGFFFYLRRYKKRHSLPYTNTRSLSSDPSSFFSKDTEKGSGLDGVHLFQYEELEEATDSFNPSKELGDGGFGTVYYGKLQDGREVAVKRLYENNYKRVEQFMNEVVILTRLRHQNLVSLYGCTSRHSRELLLVYEFISNGTVADHLHGQRSNIGMLPWQTRMNIALETANALVYLHANDIIHRDVKTNNILLDKNFRVKVADFGLSRLFPTDQTHISTAPQGTPGYVDPEYHECYQLTAKSDVYSFGVVLIELISSMPAVDITRHRHEINLSNMAISKIQQGALHELVDPCLGFESDSKVRKMINAVAEVAFQSLQSVKDMRPSMSEVLESLNDIQNDGRTKGMAEEMDIRADDAVLLKSEPPPLSPESVASNLRSSSTTPNTSG